MNGGKVFADTNILLYFLRGDKEVIEMLSGKDVVISFITELEMLSFPELTSKEEGTIRGLLENCTIIDINTEIKDLTVDFKKKSKLKLPDSIIAATSFFYKIPLLTADKQFRKVDELDLIIYEID